MRKILVPVDGSPVADRALAHAIELAQVFGQTRLVLLNVQPALDRNYPGGLLNPQAVADLRRQGEQACAAARAALDRSGVPYELEVVFGHPSEVIARVALEQQCKGIVMGTRSLGGIGSALLGSTAHRVIELCDLPVTLVK